MNLTQQQIDEVNKFQASLSDEDEWLLYHRAWVTSPSNSITLEDKYFVMLRWEDYGQ